MRVVQLLVVLVRRDAERTCEHQEETHGRQVIYDFDCRSLDFGKPITAITLSLGATRCTTDDVMIS